ncbi:right-handed parallel beta-helix repeat-containing protein [Actinomadura roseirufa]|uniref:right-handed parallel beta-helix repeat-containing protein n=1 Tax=Actinomadura roseirufa TaxID=2094049 RepID=UPI0010414F57|nr:right-handed parallel beta-helix repeat-containing protein [Actinomadura roseirufa]
MGRRVILIGLSTAAVVTAGGLGAAALGSAGRDPRAHQAAPVSAPEGGVVVHVDPGGGAAKQAAAGTVSSLEEAQKVLEDRNATKATVLVKGGTYQDESFEWSYSPAGGDITVRPESGTGRVVYDGGGREGYWATVRPGSGKIHFSGMTIQNYTAGGILFRGDKETRQKISGGSVRNMVFRRIGTKYGEGKEGYGAVHMYYSWNMRIEHNDFQNLENDTVLSRIHAVYFSNGASNNTVSGNAFSKVSGDPVRASDGASGNRVTGNRFQTTGWYGLFSYFKFDRDPVCGKNNYFAGNTYGKVYPRPGRTKSFKGQPVDWDNRGKKGACRPDPIKVGSGNKYAPNARATPVN